MSSAPRHGTRVGAVGAYPVSDVPRHRDLTPASLLTFATLLAACVASEPDRNGQAPPPRARAETRETAPRAPAPPAHTMGESEPMGRGEALQEPQLVFPSRWKRAVELPGSLAAADRAMWRRYAPEVRTVTIRSSLDGAKQRALFYDSGSRERRPLLVVLHSWSASYLQNIHVPYAEFAIANDWVFVHPDFRGRNARPQATVSELAVQDVLDAVEHARANASVDDSRIYLAGYSGGAMMALVLAGRYPERWAGVLTWVAVFDLPAWYERMAGRGNRYARDIERSCGGAPRPGTRAEAECRQRSPSAHLHNASGRTRIFIAHGLRDTLASPGHAIDAFNALAAPDDRITPEEREHITKKRALPPSLADESTTELVGFAEAGTPVALHRTSRGATLVLFDGDHDMLYAPGLRWLAAQRRAEHVG